MGVLFIAVLYAYRQRKTAVEAVKQAAEAATGAFLHTGEESRTNRYYPADPGHQTSQGQSPYFPNTNPVGTSSLKPRRELPREVFRLLSKIPSPLPYIWSFILWLVHAVATVFGFVTPLVTKPISLLYSALLIVFDPVIVLLVAVYHYVVKVPMGIALAIANALYPLYLFAMTAILFGGLVGACGGLLHGGIVGPWTGRKTKEVNEVLHKDIQRLTQRRGREHSNDTIGFDHIKEEDLRGWRDEVW
ncbi:hypothetical protein FRC17_007056 [Serendipita sp. 399]|nr:hypothetical protein FRC17_007056 [Serendipita sp. 399]